MYKIEQEKNDDSGFDGEARVMWQYIPAVLGLPVEFNDEPMVHRPWLTWGLSAVIVTVFAWLAAAGVLKDTIGEMGFVPQLWYRHGGITILTSFFLHAGIWHVAANAYFLWVFGSHVEDHIGEQDSRSCFSYRRWLGGCCMRQRTRGAMCRWLGQAGRLRGYWDTMPSRFRTRRSE